MENNLCDSAVPNSSSQGYRLYKKEKLCSVIAIEQLFNGCDADCHAALAYPLRVVWRENQRRSSDAPIQFLISIPKKKLRHAVDRVQMRRRVREAFRLNRHDFPLPADRKVDVAFIYVAKSLEPYSKVQSAMQRLLKKIATT